MHKWTHEVGDVGAGAVPKITREPGVLCISHRTVTDTIVYLLHSPLCWTWSTPVAEDEEGRHGRDGIDYIPYPAEGTRIATNCHMVGRNSYRCFKRWSSYAAIRRWSRPVTAPRSM